jgi:hypothetical protein
MFGSSKLLQFVRSRSIAFQFAFKTTNESRISGVLRTLSGATGATSVPPHGDGLLVLLDVLEELDCALQLPAVDRLSSLARVLEGDAEVGTARAGRLRGLDLGGCVSDLMVGVEALVNSILSKIGLSLLECHVKLP